MIIFLAGVHGVGKTFLGKPVAESLGIKYATASTLIRAELGTGNWDDQKRTVGIDKNQEALIAAVSRISEDNNILILDGHFVLKNESEELVSLPIEIFKRLKIKYIILLVAPSDVVATRLSERNAMQTLKSIEELAAAEQEHALLISSELKINLIKLSSPTEGELRLTIQRVIS